MGLQENEKNKKTKQKKKKGNRSNGIENQGCLVFLVTLFFFIFVWVLSDIRSGRLGLRGGRFEPIPDGSNLQLCFCY
jgi:hypothetical protein